MGSPVRSPAPGAHRERSEERGQEGNREDTGLAGVGIHWGQRRRLASRLCALALPTRIERKSQVQSIAQFEAREARPPFLIFGGVPSASLQDRGSGQHRCPRGRRCGFPEWARVSPGHVVRLPPPWGTREGAPGSWLLPGRLGMGRPSKEGFPLRWRPSRSVLRTQPASVSVRPPLPSVRSPLRGAGDPKLASGLKLGSHRPSPLRPRVTQGSSRPPPSVSVWGL